MLVTRSAATWMIPVALSALLIQCSSNVARPLVTYRVLQLDGGAFEIGIIGASFSLLPAATALLAGRWLDSRREPPMIGLGALLTGVGALPMIWSVNLWLLAAGCALMGLGQVLNLIGLQTQIANNSPPERQDARYGIFTVFVALGQIVGPMLGTAAGSMGGTGQVATVPGFVIAGVAGVLGALVTIRMRTVDPAHRLAGAAKSQTSQRVGVRRVLGTRGVPAYIYLGMALFIAVDLIAVFLPAHAEHNGVDAHLVGLLLGLRATCTMLSRLCLTPLVRLLGRTTLTRSSVLLAGLVLALVPWMESPVLLFAAMALAGFPLGVGQPLAMSELAQRTPSDLRGTAMGLRMMANRLAQVGVPTLVGAIAASAGVGSAFWMMGALLVAAGVLPGLGGTESSVRRR